MYILVMLLQLHLSIFLETDVQSLEGRRVQTQQNEQELSQPPGFTTPFAINHRGKEKKKITSSKVESSVSTLESMLQLAQESLKVGELLGISTAKGKDATIRQIRCTVWVIRIIWVSLGCILAFIYKRD